jgi:hypothetical protein
MPTGLHPVLSSQDDQLETNLSLKEASQPKQSTGNSPELAPAVRSDWVIAALGFTLTAGFFGLLFVLCFHNVPDANLAMMNIVLGSLGTAWIGAMAYFFGSSRNDQPKGWIVYRSQPRDQ